MRVHSIILAAIRGLALIAFVLIPTIGVSSQDKAEYKAKKHEAKMNKEFCSSDSWSSGDKVSFKELREMTIPASGLLDVDGGRNGGIKVKGENRSDILVRACVQAWSTSADESNWSVSYEIRVPSSTDLKLLAHNGGISIGGVEGTLEFETTNGGVHLSDVAGAVKGRTTNGGVNVMLSGSTWKGSGLDVTTSNGGVHLSMPETYAANIETGTVNGGFRSDIAALNIEGTEKTRSRRINTAINGGGAPIRVVTTNGGIKISSAERTANY